MSIINTPEPFLGITTSQPVPPNCFHSLFKLWSKARDSDWRCIWRVNLDLSPVIQALYPPRPRSQPSSSGLRRGATSAQLKVIISSQSERFSPLESSGARYWIKQTLQPVTASAQPLLTHRQESPEWAGYSRIRGRKDLKDVLWAGLDLWQICLSTSNLSGDGKRLLHEGKRTILPVDKQAERITVSCLCIRKKLQQQLKGGVHVVSC